MNNYIPRFLFDSTVFTSFIIALIFLVNPFGLWMPTMMHMLVLGIFIASLLFFIALFWKERVVDEREAAHSLFAGRVAFISGILTAAVAIVVQSIRHEIDVWLAIVLCVMVISKYCARLYAEYKK